MILKSLHKSLKISESTNPTVKKVSYIGLGLSLLGLADATYLTIAHYTTKIVLACPDTGFINCAKVTTSSYSEVLGIPVALLGLLFFVGMVVVQQPILWRSTANWFRRMRLIFSIIGQISVFYLLYVEFHLLHAICLFCSGVHILTFGIFTTTVIGTSLINKETLEETKPTK